MFAAEYVIQSLRLSAKVGDLSWAWLGWVVWLVGLLVGWVGVWTAWLADLAGLGDWLRRWWGHDKNSYIIAERG